MKFKSVLAIALSAASFGASFVATQASANNGSPCLQACHREYRICREVTPEKEHLCFQRHRECMSQCEYDWD